MSSEKLNIKFRKAVEFANNYSKPLPPDLLLKFYAYYKIANNNIDNPRGNIPLINAFKTNALLQARNISPKQAMKKYIELVDTILK